MLKYVKLTYAARLPHLKQKDYSSTHFYLTIAYFFRSIVTELAHFISKNMSYLKMHNLPPLEKTSSLIRLFDLGLVHSAYIYKNIFS